MNVNCKQKLDSSKYCPESCDSLYRDKCIMKVDEKFNGGVRLLYEEGKLFNHYIRRVDCPLKDIGTLYYTNLRPIEDRMSTAWSEYAK